MKLLVSLTLSFCLFFSSFAQNQLPKLPLSSGDSAKIALNDSLYHAFLKQNNYKEAARHLNDNAMIFWKHNYFDQAINYFQKSIKLNQIIQNYDGIAKISTNLALIYSDKGDYQKAYNYFEKTLAVRTAKNERYGILSALKNESVVLNNLKKYNLSIKKLLKALDIARELNDITEMRSVYGMLAETYQKAGNPKKSLYYYQYFKTFNDYIQRKNQKTLQEEQLKRKLLELEAEKQKLLLQQKNFELKQKEKIIGKISAEAKRLMDSLSKQQMAVKILQQRDKIKTLINQKLIQEQKRKNLIILFTSIALIISIILLSVIFIIYRQKSKLLKILSEKNKLIQQQKEELSVINKKLDQANKEFIESITYAKRIQLSLFSRNEKLASLFKDFFIIYLPKDIVSGDFYYIRKINNFIFIAVADCTGHGVPGAFLTLLGYGLLDNIIVKQKIFEPLQIMQELDNGFKDVLNQLETSSLEGMEIGLCKIDSQKNSLQFVGAGINLFYIQNNSLKTIAANKCSIGYSIYSPITHDLNKNFIIHELPLSGISWCYMMSDGLPDLLNPEGKKFSKRQVKKLLQQIHSKDGKEQQEIILNTISDWQQSMFQVDDILILGFKF